MEFDERFRNARARVTTIDRFETREQLTRNEMKSINIEKGEGTQTKYQRVRFKCFKYLFKQIPTFQTLIVVYVRVCVCVFACTYSFLFNSVCK